MGNIVLRDNKWFINGTDEIEAGDKLEIRQSDGTWKRVTIEKEHSGLFHEAPSGSVLSAEMEVRRI